MWTKLNPFNALEQIFKKRDFLNEKQVVSARTAKSELNEKYSLLTAHSRRCYELEATNTERHDIHLPPGFYRLKILVQ
jgi:hypothetical protein